MQRIMYEAAKLRKVTTEMNPDVTKAITLFEYDEPLLDSNTCGNGLDTTMNKLSNIITIVTFVFSTITSIVRCLVK